MANFSDEPARAPFPLLTAELQPPPSPRTHRALRRLQSAHNLGSRRSSLLSLQQHQQHQQQQQHQQPHGRERLHHEPPPPELAETPAAAESSPTARRDTASNNYNNSSSSGGGGGRAIPVNRSPQRARANSDASSMMTLKTVAAAAAAPRRVSAKKPVFSHGHLSLYQLIRDGPPDDDFAGALETLRWKVADEGVRSELDGMSATRIYVWLTLLDAPILKTDDYLALIHRGASPAYSKIRNDTFRTLTTDPLFRRRVSEASLIRLLNAAAWKLHDAREEQRRDRDKDRPDSSCKSTTDPSPGTPSGDESADNCGTLTLTSTAAAAAAAAAKSRSRALTLTTEGSESSGVATESGTYVQGMNVLAAPFLYAARSEAEAFVAFHALLTNECPGYIRGAMDGVHKGLQLVDKVLNIVDPRLAKYLKTKGMTAEIYAFPSVLTLSACTPPLPEVLRLWDFLFAYGPHLNIICIVAQLWRIRDDILKSPSPNRLLRSFPALQADVIKNMTIAIVQKIPDDVYSEIVAHAQ